MRAVVFHLNILETGRNKVRKVIRKFEEGSYAIAGRDSMNSGRLLEFPSPSSYE